MDQLEAQGTPASWPALLKQAGEIGLLSADVPEAFGGLDAPKTQSSWWPKPSRARAASPWRTAAPPGSARLPIVYFGTEEQKEEWLPELATGEMLGAYALTEAEQRHRRARREDHRRPRWRRVGAQRREDLHHQRRLRRRLHRLRQGRRRAVHRLHRAHADAPGVSTGAEEHKMGIQGSSTTSIVILQDARIPEANLLGEIGQGPCHRVQHPQCRTLQAGRRRHRRRRSRHRRVAQLRTPTATSSASH